MNAEVLKSYKIKCEKVYVMELDITDVMIFQKPLDFGFEEGKKHKSVRAISIIVDKDYELNNIYNLAKSCKLLEELNFIGAVEKEKEVSYTFRFNLIANDSDVKPNFQKVIEFFSKNKVKVESQHLGSQTV